MGKRLREPPNASLDGVFAKGNWASLLRLEGPPTPRVLLYGNWTGPGSFARFPVKKPRDWVWVELWWLRALGEPRFRDKTIELGLGPGEFRKYRKVSLTTDLQAHVPRRPGDRLRYEIMR